MTMKKGKYCSAVGCFVYTGTKPKVTFFSFPSDSERCSKWIVSCGRKDLIGRDPHKLHKSHFLCARHFEDSKFMNVASKEKLVHDAIPTLFSMCKNFPETSPHTVSASESSKLSEFVNKELEKSETESVEKPENGISKIVKISNEVARKDPFERLSVEEIIMHAHPYLSAEVMGFFASQLRHNKKSFDGDNSNYELKWLSLSLFLQNRDMYPQLSKLFSLPSNKIICKWISGISLEPGLNTPLFSFFKEKLKTMESFEKHCMLCISEMPLEKNLTYNRGRNKVVGVVASHLERKNIVASSAMCFQVQGLNKNWKQPIAYILTSESDLDNDYIVNFLEKLLMELKNVGLIVKCMVVDMGDSLTLLKNKLHINVEQPYFIFEDENIYVLNNPLQLIVNTRDALMAYKICIGENIACWEDIEKVCSVDQYRQFKLCPRLTEKHLKLQESSRKTVKLASQVLSASVTSALETLYNIEINSTAIGTATFCNFFDQLFDCFNASDIEEIGKPLRSPLRIDSCHWEFLINASSFIDSLQFVTTSEDCNVRLDFFYGWKLNIAGLISLFNDLIRLEEFNFLLTLRINQDELENYFSVIRKWYGNKVTSSQFESAFRDICLNALLETGCKQPENFINFSKYVDEVLNVNSDNAETSTENIPENLCPENSLMYLCNFILLQYFSQHNFKCYLCRSALLANETMERNTDVGISALELFQKNPFMFPSKQFITFIENCEKIFEEKFATCVAELQLSKNICLSILNTCTFGTMLCDNSKLELIVKYYVNLRLETALSQLNENLNVSSIA